MGTKVNMALLINMFPLKGIIKEYSKRLTEELGKGYSKRNLWLMLKFYNLKEKMQTLSAQISWKHKEI